MSSSATSGVHSHDIYRNFCSACAVTLPFADTLIVLFYLLTSASAVCTDTHSAVAIRAEFG